MLNRKGFTLLELLVVIIIIGVLASVALPQFGKAVDRAREAEAANILGAILNAEFVYFQENNKFTATLTDLVVGVPTMKDWVTPTVTTGTAGASPATVTIKTTTTGTHTHGSADDHKVVGTVTDTSVKTITWTRP
jgi:prepilin-type N-terminal cleavage/methylation domain-containing protein